MKLSTPQQKLKLFKKVTNIKLGDYFYNPRYNGLHTIKKINPDEGTITLSGCCRFYDDARTTITRYTVPISYIHELIPVNMLDRASNDFLEETELGVNYSVWSVKPQPNENEYLRLCDYFFEDPRIIKKFHE